MGCFQYSHRDIFWNKFWQPNHMFHRRPRQKGTHMLNVGFLTIFEVKAIASTCRPLASLCLQRWRQMTTPQFVESANSSHQHNGQVVVEYGTIYSRHTAIQIWNLPGTRTNFFFKSCLRERPYRIIDFWSSDTVFVSARSFFLYIHLCGLGPRTRHTANPLDDFRSNMLYLIFIQGRSCYFIMSMIYPTRLYLWEKCSHCNVISPRSDVMILIKKLFCYFPIVT